MEECIKYLFDKLNDNGFRYIILIKFINYIMASFKEKKELHLH